MIKNRLGEWIEPHVLECVDCPKKSVLVGTNQQQLPKSYNIAQVKPYYSPIENSEVILSEIGRGLSSFKSHNDADLILATVIFGPNDRRSLCKKAKIAKCNDINGLIEGESYDTRVDSTLAQKFSESMGHVRANCSNLYLLIS